MATMALPIRELSAYAQYEAASAQKTFWEVAEAKARAASFDVALWMKTRSLSGAMVRLADTQQKLIDCLAKDNFDHFDAGTFDKIAGDLERLVSMTYSFVDDMYHTSSEDCLAVWRPKLDRIYELTNHLDNYAESFRIASDDACTALLADIATKVTADARESVTVP